MNSIITCNGVPLNYDLSIAGCGTCWLSASVHVFIYQLWSRQVQSSLYYDRQ